MPLNLAAIIKKAGLDFDLSDDAAKAINDAIDEAEEPLREKRDELLETQKDLKKQIKDLTASEKEAKGRAGEAETKAEGLTAELGEAKKAHDDPERDERLKAIYQKQQDEAVAKKQAEIDERDTKISGLEGKERDRKLETDFNAAFKKNSVIEKHRRGLRLEMMADHNVEVDDSGRTMVDGISVEDHIGAFAGDKANEIYIGAADNAGGGGQGSGADGGKKTNPWKKGPDFSLSQQGDLVKQDPARARQLAKDAGVTPNF